MKKLPYFAAMVLMTGLTGCGTQDSRKGSASSSTPSEVSIAPAAGTGSSQVFTLQVPDNVAGVRSGTVRILFNTDVDGRNACYLYFLRDSRFLALVKDSGEGTDNASVGAAARLENSQCVVSAEKASVEESNGRLIMRMAIDFKPGFSGKKNIYVAVTSDASQPVSFRQAGEWVVP